MPYLCRPLKIPCRDSEKGNALTQPFARLIKGNWENMNLLDR